MNPARSVLIVTHQLGPRDIDGAKQEQGVIHDCISVFNAARSSLVDLQALLASPPQDDHEVNFALVRAAVLQQRLELAAIRRLGALAFLVKALEDVVALPAAVFLAGTELRREAGPSRPRPAGRSRPLSLS